MKRPVVGAGRTVRFLVLMLAVATGGCGYQLRGAASFPPGLDAIHVSGPPDIRDEVAQVLESGGIRVEPTTGETTPVLRLSDQKFSRRVLSVDSNTGKAREFEIAYRIAFQLVGGDGIDLVEEQFVTLHRDYLFDADEVLGKSREQRVLRDEMRRDAATRIVRRIESALGS